MTVLKQAKFISNRTRGKTRQMRVKTQGDRGIEIWGSNLKSLRPRWETSFTLGSQDLNLWGMRLCARDFAKCWDIETKHGDKSRNRWVQYNGLGVVLEVLGGQLWLGRAAQIGADKVGRVYCIRQG